jgi:hypothetical protein
MTRGVCQDLWQAEALADGRLVGESRASFERHAAVCVDCTRELRALGEIAAVMRELPEEKRTPLEHARQRKQLLAQANDSLVRDGRPRARALVMMLAAALTVMAVFVVYRAWPRVVAAPVSTQVASASPAGPRFDVSPIEGATWHDQSEGAVGRVVLDRGTLWVHVHRLVPGQRFLLDLPDGQIEVHGTRFVAEVVDGSTQRVEVAEGVVALRLRGQDGEQRLWAGERWSKPAPPVPAEPPRATVDAPLPGPTAAPAVGSLLRGSHTFAAAPPSTPGDSVSASRTVRSAGNVGKDDPSPTRPASASASGSASGSASALFAEAMAAFDAGAFDRADSLFGRFAADFANDPRTEDALFLRAVARSRAGDPAGAAQRAHEYLARFPLGLRRQEALRLAGPSSP